MRSLATLMLVIAAASCLYASWSMTIDDGSSFTFQVNDLQHEAAGMRGRARMSDVDQPQ